MKLNATQINQIKAFIEDKGIVYPDVQLEAIDHVASRVEALLTQNPELSVDEAIDITHAEFAPAGFKVFEHAMSTSVRNRNLKTFTDTLTSFISWKYLPGLALLIYLFDKVYTGMQAPKYFFLTLDTLFTVIFIGYMFVQARRFNKYDKLLTSRLVWRYNGGLNFVILLWSFAGIFRMYQTLDTNYAGVIFGSLLVVMILAFITVNAVNNAAVKSCFELNEKYHIV